jgi:hypothetical protein
MSTIDSAKVNLTPKNKNRVEPDSACLVTTDDCAAAAAELRVLFTQEVADSAQEVVDNFIAPVERLPVASKQRRVGESDVRAIALRGVEGAMIDYQIALAIETTRCARPHPDFLRQFRDLKKWPTKQRLHNILERDKDENNLRPAESAILFAILRLGIFGEDVPPDWVAELGDSPDHLRNVAETVCEHFAYKIDRHGRPRDIAFEEYANRLVQLYEDLTGRPITYAKATDTSRGRKAGEPYGDGLDFLLAGLRLIDQTCTSHQAAAPSRSICEGDDSALPTLGHVFERLGLVEGLSARARDDCRSALRGLARIIGRPLNEIAASPRVLRSRMDKLAPARFGLSRGRWANIRSLVLKALKLAGVAALPSRYVSPLPPEWQQLYDLLPKRPQRVNLSRFTRRCSELGIAPQDVAQETFQRFADELEHYGLRSRPREAYREACRAWNWAVKNVPGWPRTIIVVPDRRNRYSRPWESFPPSLKADIDAMLDAAISPDPLSPTSRRPIKPVSARSRATLLRRFVSALVLSGRDPLTLRTIADLVEPETVRQGLRFFLKRNGGRSSADIHQTAKLMCTLAKHWVGVPPDHLAVLVAIRNRLDPGRHGMTEKNRATLRCFEDEALVAKFLAFPETIALRHRNRTEIKVRHAVEVEIALAIEFLTVAPVRCANLAAIHLERNLIRIGSGKAAQMHLYFPADAVKNETELEFTLPSSTRALIELYLSKFRPKLVRARNDSLFPGEAEEPKQAALLSSQIAKTVEREIGMRLTAHQFRHLAGFLYLKANPGGHEVVRRLLGHRSIETTIRFYAGMEISEAIRHYDRHIESRRAELAQASSDAKRKGSRSRRHA